MSGNTLSAAYRTALVIVLVYVLWALIPGVRNYAQLVSRGAQQSRAAVRPRGDKLSAASLEAALVRTNRFPADAKIRCLPAGREWDYLCSYAPNRRRTPARVQFGVVVDATHWVKVSSIVPVGVRVPAPE